MVSVAIELGYRGQERVTVAIAGVTVVSVAIEVGYRGQERVSVAIAGGYSG